MNKIIIYITYPIKANKSVACCLALLERFGTKLRRRNDPDENVAPNNTSQ